MPPSWLGDERPHLSHPSQLVGKDPGLTVLGLLGATHRLARRSAEPVHSPGFDSGTTGNPARSPKELIDT